jgi:hypothetical protein
LFASTRFAHVAMEIAGRLLGAQPIRDIAPNVLLRLRRQRRIGVDRGEVAQTLLVRGGVAD